MQKIFVKKERHARLEISSASLGRIELNGLIEASSKIHTPFKGDNWVFFTPLASKDIVADVYSFLKMNLIIILKIFLYLAHLNVIIAISHHI